MPPALLGSTPNARGPMSGPFTRIAVDVTFLKQLSPPFVAGAALPADTSLVRVPHCSVAFYRYLYDTVGAPYVWWLRRTTPDAELREMLADPDVSIHVLYRGHEPVGFFELDGQAGRAMNLSYFGLMPQAVGCGMGPAFLRAAIDEAWRRKPSMITVNTCTADHPRALPNYLHAGFQIIRTVHEIWDVPNRLGLVIPAHLKI
jgi:GNAT superfamily N-acetyltransferase